jgi:hypothetical protein
MWRPFKKKPDRPPPLPYEEVDNKKPCCPHRIYNNVNAAYMEFKTSTDTDIGAAAAILEKVSARLGFKRINEVEPVFTAIDTTTRQMREAYFQAYETYKTNVCMHYDLPAEATRNSLKLSQRASYVTYELIQVQGQLEGAADVATMTRILAQIAKGLEMGAPETNRRAEQAQDKINAWGRPPEALSPADGDQQP